MKKTTIKKICIAAVFVLVVLSLVAILRPKPAPIPTFNFLSGRKITAQYKVDKTFNSETHLIYSFEADSNTVIADANSELSNLGYINNSNTRGISPYIAMFSLPGKNHGDSITVRIIKNNKLVVYETPKNSDYITPTQYVYNMKEGWVSVEAIETKKYNRFIAYVKLILNKFRGSE